MGNRNRTSDEHIVDKVLLVKLIKLAQGKGRLVTIPLHKLTFLSEKQMNDKGLKGFNYTFFRDFFGPAAPEIYGDFGELIGAGLIRDCPFRLTSSGEELLEGLEAAMRRNGNRSIVEIIEEVTRKNSIETKALKEKVYKMEIKLPNGSTMRVSDIPYQPDNKILMMNKIPAGSSRRTFSLEDGEVETFEVMMDAELRESLKKAEDDARGGRITLRPPA